MYCSSFFANLASPKLLHSAIKTNKFVLYCSRFLVTLEEFAIFLCIKAVQRIEKNWGYDLETVLF